MMQEYMKSFYVKIYHNFELLSHCALAVPENKTSSMQLAYIICAANGVVFGFIGPIDSLPILY